MNVLRRVGGIRPPKLPAPDTAQVIGLGAVVAGVWEIHPPAALILGGLLALLWGEGRRGRPKP